MAGKICVAGLDPLVTFNATETGLRLEWRDGKEEWLTGEDPLVLLNDFMAQYNLEHRNRFACLSRGADWDGQLRLC